jgi:hypothetical protein
VHPAAIFLLRLFSEELLDSQSKSAQCSYASSPGGSGTVRCFDAERRGFSRRPAIARPVRIDCTKDAEYEKKNTN